MGVPKRIGKMNDWEKAICSRIKIIRDAIKWSQLNFAQQLGITRDRLASIECGRTAVRYEIAWRLRLAFGISLRWLEEGWGYADNVEHDNLPIPSATGLPQRALLSEVAQKFPHLGENLVAIGVNVSSQNDKSDKQITPGNQQELLKAVLMLLEGEEKRTSREDISNRALLESQLRILVGGWITRVPLGHAYEFTEELNCFAERFIASYPKESPAFIDKRGEKIMWERIKHANARKILVSSEFADTASRRLAQKSKASGEKSEIQKLIEQVKLKASQPGTRSELARALGVAPARISEWLSGKKEPSGECALKLLRWVTQPSKLSF